LTPLQINLWFDTQAEEAARFYTSVFKDGKVGQIDRYPDAGKEIHGREAGTVMTVEWTVNGTRFIGLNGGPDFKFNEAISLVKSATTRLKWTTTGTS
jgi:predicted 3-demethylubiquinone-9 3-methyltransferase (glyoxalase superfamily)